MDPVQDIILIDSGRTMAISILVLFVGLYINKKVKVLESNYIPPSVTGGILCSIIIAIIYAAGDLEIDFDLQLRDLLLLVFFSTIGLSFEPPMMPQAGTIRSCTLSNKNNSGSQPICNKVFIKHTPSVNNSHKHLYSFHTQIVHDLLPYRFVRHLSLSQRLSHHDTHSNLTQ